MATKIRNNFSDAQVKSAARTCEGNYSLMAETLNKLGKGVVSRQLAQYWAKQFTHTTATGLDYKTMARPNRELKQSRKIRLPEESDGAATRALPELKVYRSILVVPDMHCPYNHPDAINFLQAVAYTYPPDAVVNLGDETDGHAMSFHDSDPHLASAGHELVGAQEELGKLHAIFPEMRICHSNHGSLSFRKAKAHGIPVAYLKTYREVLFPTGGGEGWDWQYEHILNTKLGPVLFKHQSANPAGDAAHENVNIFVGHNHGRFEIDYKSSRSRLYYGATCGCLIDRKSAAFAYGRETKNKPVLGCAVIIDGVPHLIPMQLDEDGRWVGEL